VTVFRYGVVVLFNLAVLEEDEVLRELRVRIVRAAQQNLLVLVRRPITTREDEAATIEIALVARRHHDSWPARRRSPASARA